MTVANLLGAMDGPDLLIVLAIVLLLFGGAKLPQLARSLGEAKREFHKATTSEPVSPEEQKTVSTPDPEPHDDAPRSAGDADLPS